MAFSFSGIGNRPLPVAEHSETPTEGSVALSGTPETLNEPSFALSGSSETTNEPSVSLSGNSADFADAVKSGLNHFDPAKREAARRIEIVLDNYGNIAAKALDQETAAIDDLLRELRSGDYPALVDSLALADWLVQLDVENRTF
jgi:hypothetical protein